MKDFIGAALMVIFIALAFIVVMMFQPAEAAQIHCYAPVGAHYEVVTCK